MTELVIHQTFLGQNLDDHPAEGERPVDSELSTTSVVAVSTTRLIALGKRSLGTRAVVSAIAGVAAFDSRRTGSPSGTTLKSTLWGIMLGEVKEYWLRVRWRVLSV
jgi:hypothetical protein